MHDRPYGWRCAWLCLVVIRGLLVAGCATAKVNAGIPELPLRKPSSGAAKIGVARVEDSRANRIVGSVSDGLFQSMDLLAGPDLLGYIDRRFRNGLTERGFDPVAALDPTKTALAQPYKVVVVTLQSARFGFASIPWGITGSSVSIAVQIYSLRRDLIFSGNYSGSHEERVSLVTTGVVAGKIIAVSAEDAIKAAFADPNLEKAIR